MDQRGISASKILGIFETENGNVDVSSAIIFKNYMREAATEICGKWKRSFSKKHEKWWDVKVKDTVEKKK